MHVGKKILFMTLQIYTFMKINMWYTISIIDFLRRIEIKGDKKWVKEKK